MTGNQKLAIAGVGCGVLVLALLFCGAGVAFMGREAARPPVRATAAAQPTPPAPSMQLDRNRTDEPLPSGVPFWPFGKQHPIALPVGTHVERIGNMPHSGMPLDLAGWAAPLVRVSQGPHKGEQGDVVEEDLDR